MINLPTLKTLSLPDFSAYDAQRRLFLQQTFGEAYFNQTDVERWDQLTARFEPFLASDEDRRQFNIFCKRGQLCGYFERYLFLLTNTHPDYALSDDKREALKTKILEPIRNPVGEVGTITHLEEALFEHERADDWISYELHVYRQNAIRLLAESYMRFYDIGIGMSIPVIDHMKKRALARDIGLSFYYQLGNASLFEDERTRLNRYFDDRIDNCVNHYHQEMVSHLAHFVLQEMVQALGGHLQEEAFADWEQTPLSLPDEALQALTALIAKYFPKHSPMALMQEDEDNILQNRGQVRQRLRQYVEEALLEKGYLVGLDAIRANTVERSNVWCPSFINLDEILNCPEEQFVSLDPVILDAYPALLDAHPARMTNYTLRQFGQAIPLQFRIYPSLLKKLVAETGHFLKAAENSNDVLEWNSSIEALVAVSKIDRGYLKELPPSLWANEQFAQALVGYDKRFLPLFEQSIRQRLVRNSSISLEGQWSNISKKSPAIYQQLQHMDVANQFDSVHFLSCISLLLEQQHISPLQWLELTTSLTPSLLIDILQYRASQCYPAPSVPIDWLSLVDVENTLKEIWGHNTYLEARTQLLVHLLRANSGNATKQKQMLDLFLGSESWFQAMLSYQSQYGTLFPGLGRYLRSNNYLIQSLRALTSLLWAGIKGICIPPLWLLGQCFWALAWCVLLSTFALACASALAIETGAIVFVYSVYAWWMLIGMGELLPWFVIVANEGAWGIVISILFGFLPLVATAVGAAIWAAIDIEGLNNASNALTRFCSLALADCRKALDVSWNALWHNMHGLILQMGRMVSGSSGAPLSKEEAFIFAIEGALLQGLTCNHDCNQYDKALIIVWQQMLKDAGEFEDLSVFRRLIHVPYAVSFDGNVRQVSFWQLANVTSAEASVASARKASMFSFFRAHPESELVRLLKEHGLAEPVLEKEAEEAVALAIG